jgi:hypothetical protein
MQMRAFQIFRLTIVILLGLLGVPASAGTHAPMHIGIRCQSDYQNNWNPTIDAYTMCGNNFKNTISSTDTIDFYFNLHGAVPAFVNGNGAETCTPCGGVDSVDFFLMYTHGGIESDTNAIFGMWDFQSLARTSPMRMDRLQVFVAYACDTFRTSDGHFWDRWGPAFRGGLKIGLGAHDLFWDGNPQKGKDFASRMQNGEAIGLAWLEAVWYADNRNNPSAVATGINANDCYRRAGANLATVQQIGAIRDNQIGYVCWSEWSS